MGSRRSMAVGVLASLASPLFGAGMLHLLVLTGFLAFLRMVEWFLAGFAPGFATAASFVFGLLGASYAARLLVVNVEAIAEGSGEAPGLPDPREVEELFGALLRLIGVGFFVVLPLLLAGILNLGSGGLSPWLLVLGAVYFPAGILGVAVRGETGGCFPDTAGAVIRGAGARYFFPAALSVGTALLVSWSHAGEGARASIALRLGFDVAAAWLVLSMLHGTGALHRDIPAVSRSVPFPPPAPVSSERTAPPRPMTDIERILAERLKQEAERPPSPPSA